MSTDPEALRPLVLEMSPEERAVLPSRLRRLAVDEATLAWQAAKAARDAVLEDPAASPEAIAEARAAWAAVKAAQGA